MSQVLSCWVRPFQPQDWQTCHPCQVQIDGTAVKRSLAPDAISILNKWRCRADVRSWGCAPNAESDFLFFLKTWHYGLGLVDWSDFYLEILLWVPAKIAQFLSGQCYGFSKNYENSIQIGFWVPRVLSGVLQYSCELAWWFVGATVQPLGCGKQEGSVLRDM